MSILNQFKKGEFTQFKESVYEGLRNPNEPHLAFLLLLDTSDSMNSKVGLKTKIQLLNEAVAGLKEQMMMDDLAASRVDIAVVEFNSTARVVCDWVPLSAFEAPRLHASGLTSMGEAGLMAIDMVKARRKFYKQMGTPSFQGHIFMITDGAPTDDTTALQQRILHEESKGTHGKLKWFSCGVPGADEAFLGGLSKRKVAVETNDFGKLFQWIGDSLTVVSCSNSYTGGDGEGTDQQVPLPNLPEGMHKIAECRRIDPDW